MDVIGHNKSVTETSETLTTPRILVLTTEPLPLNGCSTTGAGLRAWGLFKGLCAHNIDAIIATPAQIDIANTPDNVLFFRRNHLSELIEQVQPTAIVMQHWGLVCELPSPLSIPLAIDLAGPHLMERLFWGNKDLSKDLTEKLDALRQADFITVSGAYQRHYFYSYLSMAGFDLRAQDIPIIPFSVEPLSSDDKSAIANSQREPYSFVYGGMFLAWQNPEKAIRALLDEMDKVNKGKLYFFGGTHPVIDASAGRFAELNEFLQNHPRVTYSGIVPYEQLKAVYQKVSVALDLMAFNPERELAYTTRTMVYLRYGLPVLHDNYSELGAIIEKTNCGWACPPDDEDNFRATIRSILNDESDLERKRLNALIISQSHDWNHTVEPLVQWCQNPQYRENKLQYSNSNEMKQLRQKYAEVSHQYETLRGKFSVRLACKLPALAILLALPAWPCAWIAARLLNHNFSSTCDKEES